MRGSGGNLGEDEREGLPDRWEESYTLWEGPRDLFWEPTCMVSYNFKGHVIIISFFCVYIGYKPCVCIYEMLCFLYHLCNYYFFAMLA